MYRPVADTDSPTTQPGTFFMMRASSSSSRLRFAAHLLPVSSRFVWCRRRLCGQQGGAQARTGAGAPRHNTRRTQARPTQTHRLRSAAALLCSPDVLLRLQHRHERRARQLQLARVGPVWCGRRRKKEEGGGGRLSVERPRCCRRCHCCCRRHCCAAACPRSQPNAAAAAPPPPRPHLRCWIMP